MSPLLQDADSLAVRGKRIVEAFQGSVRVWPVSPPAAPIGVGGSSSSPSSATITWGPIAGATAYEVTRDGAPLATVTGTGGGPPPTRHTDTTVQPSTTYIYQVAAVTSQGAGAPSDPVIIKTAAPLAPTLRLTPSTTSAEVYFTTVTFTLDVTANRAEGSYTLQRQMPNQGWVDVAAMPSGPDAPLTLTNAIPAGQYEIGFWGSSASFRVHFVGTGTGIGLDVYSPNVNVSFNYRQRNESVSIRTAPSSSPPLFMETWYSHAARVEINVDPGMQSLIASATFHTTTSEGYYCTGDVHNPYVQWFTMDPTPAQTAGLGGGPVGLSWGGSDWMYVADHAYNRFSGFGWRLAGYETVPNPVWGIGVTALISPTVTIHYVDGYRPLTAQIGGGTFLSPNRILIG